MTANICQRIRGRDLSKRRINAPVLLLLVTRNSILNYFSPRVQKRCELAHVLISPFVGGQCVQIPGHSGVPPQAYIYMCVSISGGGRRVDEDECVYSFNMAPEMTQANYNPGSKKHRNIELRAEFHEDVSGSYAAFPL